MDIERLKRLNALAGELKVQGIAQDRSDAAYLAVSMVGQGEEQSFTDMSLGARQTLVAEQIVEQHTQPGTLVAEGQPTQMPQPQEVAQQPLTAEAPQVQQPAPQIIQQGMQKEEVEKVLQVFANQFVSQINELQQKLDQSTARISSLSQQLEKLAQQKPKQTTLSAAPSVADATPQKESALTETAQEPDVSVEKIFYFGKK